MRFQLIEQKPKTKVIAVQSKTKPIRLGIIEWWNTWRCYVFLPNKDTLFNAECLNDIQSYIKELEKEHGKEQEKKIHGKKKN